LGENERKGDFLVAGFKKAALDDYETVEGAKKR